jgi:hypothetical protein
MAAVSRRGQVDTEGLKVNCPTYQTLTPTGRVEAMEKLVFTAASVASRRGLNRLADAADR